MQQPPALMQAVIDARLCELAAAADRQRLRAKPNSSGHRWREWARSRSRRAFGVVVPRSAVVRRKLRRAPSV